MKKAIVSLQSLAPYSSSKFHNTDKLEKEAPDDYEHRTWREKAHYDKKTGEIYIPAMCFANSIKDAAQYASLRVKGKGASTWTKHFEAGITILQRGIATGITKDSVDGEWVYCNADGKRNSGTRVMRCFPVIPEWQGEIEYVVFDDAITQEVFLEVLATAGMLIGIGRFRPRNRGNYGRYRATAMQWVENCTL